MKVGVAIPQSGDLDGPLLREFAEHAQALGFGSLWVGDHLVFPATLPRATYPYVAGMHGSANLFDDRSWTESMVTLATATGAAPGVDIGFSVLLPALRNPIVMAKQLATLDLLSGGRLVIGMGVGWLREEYAALGVPFDERVDRTVEALTIMRELWGGETVSYQGQFWHVHEVVQRPKPIQGVDIPCWYGGNNLTLLARMATIFGGWLPYEPTVDEIAAGRRVVQTARAEAERTDHFDFGAVTRLPLTADQNAEQATSVLKTYRDAGLDTLVVLASMGRGVRENLPRLERLRRYLDSLPAGAG